MNETNQWDFIIIGAGICGLSLGALLANDGYKVLILEKAKNVGGRARVVEKHGFVLDYGIHTVRFGKKSALAKTLKAILKPSQEKINFKELGTSFFYLETEKEVEPHWEILPTGLSGITKGKYFSLGKLRKVLTKMVLAKKKKNLNLSVADWQKGKNLNKQGMLYLRLITASMQVCPILERASMGELRRNLAEVTKKRISVTYPVGGWDLIFKRLIDKMKEGDNKLLTDHEVSEIVLVDKKAIGVKCSDKEFKAKDIIISVPVQKIFSFLSEDKCDPDFIKTCKGLRPTCGLSLDIGLSKRISDETGLFYFSSPLMFGFFTSNLDPGSAPEGKQLFTICSPQEVENLDNKEFGNKLLEKVRAKLFEGFPEMEENIEFERPLFTIFDGAEVNIKQYQELRPQFVVPGLSNLYLVGDSTAGKGAGGDIGHNSVWAVYNLLQKNLNT